MLEIEVGEIRGICPVYKVGDRMIIDGATILLDKDKGHAYMHCVDPENLTLRAER